MQCNLGLIEDMDVRVRSINSSDLPIVRVNSASQSTITTRLRIHQYSRVYSDNIDKIFKAILTVLSLSSIALALPSEEVVALKSRDSCVYYCGSVCYWQSDINAAQAKGYSLLESGSTIDDYPHVYNDYEGFTFPVSGTYYEYPIMSSYEVFTSGSPGADRVIFNGNDQFAGLITHTGASGDDFVACTTA